MTDLTYDKTFFEATYAIFYFFAVLVSPIVLFSVAVSFIVFIITYINKKRPEIWEISVHCMFTFFGAVIGTLSGLPSTMPADQVLPAIITMVAGIAAYLSTKDLNIRFRNLIPLFVFQFLLGALAGFFYGDWLKG